MNFDLFLISALVGAFGLSFIGSLLIAIVSFIVCGLIQKAYNDVCNIYNDKLIFERSIIISLFIGLICLIPIFIDDIPDAIIHSNKQRLISYYTQEEVIKKKLEPIIEDYLKNIDNFIKNPNITVNVNKKGDSE